MTELETEVVVLGFMPLLFLAILVGFVTGSTIFFLTRLFAEKSLQGGSRRVSIFHKPGVMRPLLPNEMMTEMLEDIGFVVFLESQCEIPGGTVYPALRNLAERHPLLSARIVTDTTNANKESRYFEEITENKSIDFEDIRTQRWEDVLRDLMVDKIDSATGPLWRVRFVTITGNAEDETDVHKYALILNFHHSICDGACIPDLCGTLMKDIDTLLSGGDIETFSPRQLIHEERLPLEIRKPAKWKDSLGLYLTLAKEQLFGFKNVYLEKFPPKEHESPATTKVTMFEMPVEETEQLKLKCHANGITVHGALTAAAAIAMHKLCCSRKAPKALTMHTMHAVNLRKQCRPPISNADLGSYFTGMFMDLTVGPNLDFWSLAKSVVQDLHDTIKTKGHLKFASAVISLLSRMSYEKRCELMSGEDLTKRKLSFSMSNMGAVDDIGECTNFKVTKFMGCSAEHRLQSGSVFGHIIATFHGKLQWTVSYHSNLSTQLEAENYRDKIQEVLLEAIES